MSAETPSSAIVADARRELALSSDAMARFAEMLSASPTVRLSEAALWHHFSRAFPRRPSGPEERAWFVAALELLADGGLLRLPANRSRRWDRSAAPSVPRSVDLVRTPKATTDLSWRRYPWHPSLAWVPELKAASPLEIAFLKRVHETIVQDGFRELAPMKYRSLALTGDEKRLSALVKSRLFTEGRLTLRFLNCEAELPPLAWTRIGAGSTALVFENSGPTDLAIRLLHELLEALGGKHQIGVVAYGGGAPFASSVERISTVVPRPSAIWYVGDIDVDGLRTARSAAALARAIGLPPLVPAPGFHETMLKEAASLGQPAGWPHDTYSRSKVPTPPDSALLDWLPADVRGEARKVLAAKRRIPEEVLGPSAMRRLLTSIG